MVQMFAEGVSSLLVTLKRIGKHNYEWVYLNAIMDGVGGNTADPKVVESHFEERFPSVGRPFFETIYKAIVEGKNIDAIYEPFPGLRSMVKVEGCVIPQPDGSMLVSCAFVPVQPKPTPFAKPLFPATDGVESELFEAGQLYQSIAQNFPRGTIDVLDTSLRYIYTDGTEYRLLDIDPANLVGT